jgi:hypothetical protein
MKYVIVKHACKTHWKEYFIEDPKNGVPLTASCHTTYSGRLADIRPFYEDEKAAIKDSMRLDEQNPCGGYAVCPVIE